MTIGERIIEIMSLRGISQRELSLRTGIPQSTISDWKGKRLNPGSDKILIICDVLNVDPSYLLSGSTGESKSDSSITVRKGTYEYDLLMEFKDLNKDNRLRLEGYMKALRELQANNQHPEK